MKILVKILFENETEYQQHMIRMFKVPVNPLPDKEEGPGPICTRISFNEHVDTGTLLEQGQGPREYASRICKLVTCGDEFIPTSPAQKYCPKCTEKNRKLKIKLNKLKKENPAPIKEPNIKRDF